MFMGPKTGPADALSTLLQAKLHLLWNIQPKSESSLAERASLAV
jgi:hypothetical protein